MEEQAEERREAVTLKQIRRAGQAQGTTAMEVWEALWWSGKQSRRLYKHQSRKKKKEEEGIREEGSTDLSYKCVKHDAPPPSGPEMSLCGAMVTAGVLAEADVIVGLALKRETSVRLENQEMRPAVYTCWHCV